MEEGSNAKARCATANVILWVFFVATVSQKEYKPLLCIFFHCFQWAGRPLFDLYFCAISRNTENYSFVLFFLKFDSNSFTMIRAKNFGYYHWWKSDFREQFANRPDRWVCQARVDYLLSMEQAVGAGLLSLDKAAEVHGIIGQSFFKKGHGD